MRKVSEEYFDKFEKKIIFYANIKQDLTALEKLYSSDSIVFVENFKCFKTEFKKYLEKIGIDTDAEMDFTEFDSVVANSLKSGLTRMILNMSNRDSKRGLLKKKKITN